MKKLWIFCSFSHEIYKVYIALLVKNENNVKNFLQWKGFNNKRLGYREVLQKKIIRKKTISIEASQIKDIDKKNGLKPFFNLCEAPKTR